MDEAVKPTRRIMIACAGPQKKWKNHGGVPSHLYKDKYGEPILHRTVRLLAELGFEGHDVWIIGPDERYRVPGVHLAIVKDPGYTEFHSTRPYWKINGANQNILLLGDVWFTPEALKEILSYEGRALMFFGHSQPNKLTGAPYGEILGYSWAGISNPVIDESFFRLNDAYEKKKLKRLTGWELLRYLQGADINEVPKSGLWPHVVEAGYFEEIVDLSGDIDYPRDAKRHPEFGD